MALTGSAVTTIIHAQHLDIGRLLETIGQTTGATRARQFHDLRISLAAHEAAEELAVHPRAGTDTNAVAERIAEEHHAAKTMERIEQLPLDSAAFEAAFSDFAQSVKAHAHAEQAAEWPLIEAIDDPDSIDEMTTTMRAVFELTASPDQPGTEATFADILAWARLELPDAARQEPAPSTSSQRKAATWNRRSPSRSSASSMSTPTPAERHHQKDTNMPILHASRIVRWAVLALALALLALVTRTVARKVEADDHADRTSGILRRVSQLADRKNRS